ncbi:MAG: hypothetical protein C4339_02330 [Nitrososphaerota archaeon]
MPYFTLVGHITLDYIFQEGRLRYRGLGGPPSYASALLQAEGERAYVITKHGPRPPKEWALLLAMGRMALAPGYEEPSRPTTSFSLSYRRGRRRVRLLAYCAPIAPQQLVQGPMDVALISPVMKEVDEGALAILRSRAQLSLLDPQGLLRSADERGRCRLSPPPFNPLRYADYVKLGGEEAEALLGPLAPAEALERLLARGARGILLTGRREVYLRVGGAAYHLPLPRVRALDPTGAGDIFCASFLLGLVRKGDPLLALAGAAVQAQAAVRLGLGIRKVLALKEAPSLMGKGLMRRAEILLQRLRRLSG